jgi:DNA polymerase-3 subunit epsilon
MLLSRRLYPQAPGHKLGTLAAFHALPSAGRAHRALADAEVAAALLGRIQADLCSRFGLGAAGHSLLMAVQACQRHALDAAVRRYLGAGTAAV